MFAQRQLNELAERRRLLVLEAELHRGLLNLERENLRAQFASLQAVREKFQGASPLLMAGAGVAGLLAMRHWRKLARWLPSVRTVLRTIRFWRAVSSRPAP